MSSHSHEPSGRDGVIPVFDLLVLASIPGIGSGRLRSLIDCFGEAERIYHASVKEISAIEGYSRRIAADIVRFREGPARTEAERFAERQLSRLNKIEGSVLTWWDAGYPELLRKIYDPPAFLFCRGSLDEMDKYAVAIVGTRRPTTYGIAMTERFSAELAMLGITVISGLARGIDTIAHQQVLAAGGRTLAVIGSGLDVIYPPENKPLTERIAANGAVLSEFVMGAKPDAVNFPRRNRLISGLSLGTLVVETNVNGGAMITASTALDQNREVFALPGNVVPKKASGANTLIKSGRAKLVESVDDILAELAPKLRPILRKAGKIQAAPPPAELTLFEKSVFDTMGEEPRHIDLIAEHSKLPVGDVLVHLLSLEFKGLIRQLPGKMFVHK